jgi:HK97 gp10 family phage protein
MSVKLKARVSHNLAVQLNAAAETVARKAGERVTRYSELLRDTAKINVYSLRDEGRPLPSKLADSIHIEQGQDNPVKVVADAPYALEVEFGTSRQSAQPYMSSAVLEVRNLAPLD